MVACSKAVQAAVDPCTLAAASGASMNGAGMAVTAAQAEALQKLAEVLWNTQEAQPTAGEVHSAPRAASRTSIDLGCLAHEQATRRTGTPGLSPRMLDAVHEHVASSLSWDPSNDLPFDQQYGVAGMEQSYPSSSSAYAAIAGGCSELDPSSVSDAMLLSGHVSQLKPAASCGAELHAPLLPELFTTAPLPNRTSCDLGPAAYQQQVLQGAPSLAQQLVLQQQLSLQQQQQGEELRQARAQVAELQQQLELMQVLAQPGSQALPAPALGEATSGSFTSRQRRASVHIMQQQPQQPHCSAPSRIDRRRHSMLVQGLPPSPGAQASPYKQQAQLFTVPQGMPAAPQEGLSPTLNIQSGLYGPNDVGTVAAGAATAGPAAVVPAASTPGAVPVYSQSPLYMPSNGIGHAGNMGVGVTVGHNNSHTVVRQCQTFNLGHVAPSNPAAAVAREVGPTHNHAAARRSYTFNMGPSNVSVGGSVPFGAAASSGWVPPPHRGAPRRASFTEAGMQGRPIRHSMDMGPRPEQAPEECTGHPERCAPRWAGNFWNPLAEVVRSGQIKNKGTGVFIPGQQKREEQ